MRARAAMVRAAIRRIARGSQGIGSSRYRK
jgi:hypothetical protein